MCYINKTRIVYDENGKIQKNFLENKAMIWKIKNKIESLEKVEENL